MIDENTALRAIRKLMNDLADAMAGGACESFEAYKDLTGEIRGLAKAELILKELAQAPDPD